MQKNRTPGSRGRAGVWGETGLQEGLEQSRSPLRAAGAQSHGGLRETVLNAWQMLPAGGEGAAVQSDLPPARKARIPGLWLSTTEGQPAVL